MANILNTSSVGYTEDLLVTLLKKKERKAINYLYDNYSKALFGIILNVVNKEEVAEDLLQEVFIKIWKNIDRFDPSRGRLYTWMLNIARNTSIDYNRSKQNLKDIKNQSIDNSLNDINKIENLEQKTDNIGLKGMVESLQPSYKEVIDLVYFKGFTQDETSKELNIPLGTVKTRVRAAISSLRTLFIE